MTGNARKKKDYSVGYGRPPIDGRWQPGTSGNPLGRKAKKKKPPSLMESLEEALMAPLKVTVDGKRKTMTTGQALASKFTRDALNAAGGSEIRKYLELFHRLGLMRKPDNDEDDLDDDEGSLFTEEDRRLLLIAREAIDEEEDAAEDGGGSDEIPDNESDPSP